MAKHKLYRVEADGMVRDLDDHTAAMKLFRDFVKIYGSAKLYRWEEESFYVDETPGNASQH